MNRRNFRRVLVITAVFVVALVTGAFSVVLADCTDAGGTVTCTGTDTNGFTGGNDLDVNVESGATVNNTGGGTVGIDVGTNADITNDGTVNGDVHGVEFGDGSLVNNGTITSSTDDAVATNGPGAVTVTNNDTITGGADGIDVENGSSTIVNNGNITAGDDGVETEDGTITNHGTIDGEESAVDMDGTSTLTNFGSLTGGDTSVVVSGNNDAQTVINHGTITDENGTAIDLEGGDDTVILEGESSVTGLIDGAGHSAGDTIIFRLRIRANRKDRADIAADLNGQLASGGTFQGHTWSNFEFLFNQITFFGHQDSGDGTIDCGKDPYLGQRNFISYCYPFTNDTNELSMSGDAYGG